MASPHRSVLIHEVIDAFANCKIEIFIDGTLGAGGHAEALLQSHPEIQHYIGFDQDPSALNLAKEKLKPWSDRVTFIQDNFASMALHLKKLGMMHADAILLDIGVSSMQLDSPERGFSFRFDGPLDMRMDPNNHMSAAIAVNTLTEEELGKIFREYGEEKKWRAAAHAIVQARAERPLVTTQDLVEVLLRVLPQPPPWKRKSELHPATLIFQALRIYVNRELQVLEEVLPKAIDLLSPGGRMAIISFHSLEDRIVKNLLRFMASDKYDTSGMQGLFLDKEQQVRLLTRKPIMATEQEIMENPRARSAKLRVAEKL